MLLYLFLPPVVDEPGSLLLLRSLLVVLDPLLVLPPDVRLELVEDALDLVLSVLEGEPSVLPSCKSSTNSAPSRRVGDDSRDEAASAESKSGDRCRYCIGT